MPVKARGARDATAYPGRMTRFEAGWAAQRIAAVREALASRLWPVPALAVVAAVALGIVFPILDREVDGQLPPLLSSLLFSGGTDAARAVLSAIAGSLITATSLTFSLTIVALQLASTQASPRLLRLFASDGMVHGTLALFLATFSYALAVLRVIADAEDSPFVPRISVTVASLLTLASVIVLTIFLGHLARQLRVETMMRDVHDEVSATLKRLADAPFDGTDDATAPPTSAHTVAAASSGFLTQIDRHALLELATEEDIVIAESHPVGASIIAETPLAHWWNRDEHARASEETRQRVHHIEDALRAAHHTNYERTTSQDVELGVRQLADIAAKALSPGVNDPTTAVHALSHITDVLREVADTAPLPAVLVDEDRTPRLIPRRQEWSDLVEVGLQQIRRRGAGDPVVVERLYRALAQLGYVIAPHLRPILHAQLARLNESVGGQDYDQTERSRFARLAREADAVLRGAVQPNGAR